MSIDRVGYGHKVLFVAEDAGALRFLMQRWPNQTVTGEQLSAKANFSGHGKGHRELEFNSSYVSTPHSYPKP